MDIVFQEEENKLAEIEEKIGAVATRYEVSAQKLQKEIADYWVFDYEDIENKQYLLRQRASDLAWAKQFRSYQPSPYFGRLDLDEENSDKTITIYIGKEGIADRSENMVVDWRAPLGECYYATNQKDFKVNGTNYRLALRRSLDIKDATLVRYRTTYDSEAVSLVGDIIDPFLLAVLKDKRRHNRLTDIIRTIQGNQNSIIRRPRSENFVVQGCAGSGKTMILLHRLSYLKFNNRNMSLNGVKIITPNKFFNAHINELSVELGLTAIERFSVEEYYVALIKRYSSKITADANVQSEMGLSVDLLTEIYSLQYMSDEISCYHKYWDEIISKIDGTQLNRYFERLNIAWPDTNLHSSATASQLSMGVRQIMSDISKIENDIESTRSKLDEILNKLATKQSEYVDASAILESTRNQTVIRVEFEIKKVSSEIREYETRIDSLQRQIGTLKLQREQKEKRVEQLVADNNMLSARADYVNYDKFVQINDARGDIIRAKCHSLVLEISEAEMAYKKTAAYNFGKRSALRKRIAEGKERFSKEVERIVAEEMQKNQVELKALRNTITEQSKKMQRLVNALQSEGEALRAMKVRDSSLRECILLLTSKDQPAVRKRLSPTTDKECYFLLSTYEEKRSIAIGKATKIRELEEDKIKLEHKLSDLNKRKYSSEEKDYILNCASFVSRLQFDDIIENVMDRNLQEKYCKYNQKYTKKSYRYKLYLKLLYCALYFARPINPDSFLNIDEAQDISIAEYRVLRMVLGDRCVFNLYGDINQLVYSYKGIDDWKKISEITTGNIYVLNENYRNTNQITDFCNMEFYSEVFPIGVSGEEVEEKDIVSAVMSICEMKKKKPFRRVAIIHRGGVKAIEESLHALLEKQDISWNAVNDSKVSVLSVEMAKGLEFEAVVAIVDHMSDNEKYIAYTRALDHLTVVRDEYSIKASTDYTEG